MTEHTKADYEMALAAAKKIIADLGHENSSLRDDLFHLRNRMVARKGLAIMLAIWLVIIVVNLMRGAG